MEEKVQIQELNAETFEFQNYLDSDNSLISVSNLDTTFKSDSDYIEFYVFDESQNKIYPTQGVIPLTSYSVLNGDVNINPEKDLKNLSFDKGSYYILYNFYRKSLKSDPTSKYYIKEISSDRTEIRLDSNFISNEDMISSTTNFINYREEEGHFVDFLLNFGDNKTIISNNIKLDTTILDDPTILIKLYEPLPEDFDLKMELWVVEELSNPLLYQLKFPANIIIDQDFEFIQGPNLNLNVKNQLGSPSQVFSLDTLVNTTLTSSQNQLLNLLDQQGTNININYEDFGEFIHFSSAKTRLENFMYKVGLIESFTNVISSSLGSIEGRSLLTTEYSASKAVYENKINSIISNFDGYDYFLYYNSGSSFSYPKSNTQQPYELQSTSSIEVLNWVGSNNPSNAYYGGLAVTASEYDDSNQDYLYNSIPEYLRDDPDNKQYDLFIDMVAQQYDNTWIYTKDITKKFDGDNRLEHGISKDLIDVAIKDFGVKLYSNNFSNVDLYTAFLGLTPNGSTFPFPEITSEFPTPSGYEYVDTLVSSSNDTMPLNDINKRIYKRIYHNLPYLLKTKGTVAGLRALITSYGIPDTILRINEFGGKDRNNSNDWDLKQRAFNYAFDTEGNNYFTSSFTPNNKFSTTSPETIQFRFKSDGIPTKLSQSLYYLNDNRSALVLKYTGSGLTSGSYSGAGLDPYNEYGTLSFIPDMNKANISASLYFPFFNNEWWSVQTTIDTSYPFTNPTASLFAGNQINNSLGFYGSSSITDGFSSTYYVGANKINFPTGGTNIVVGGETYEMFSGLYQEIRYYNTKISSSVFKDYTMNPYSFEGNNINSAPEELIFRAGLGSQLNTGSFESIHPKVTGSNNFTTSSFTSDSRFYVSSPSFVPNKEYIYQDQVPSGIKNRITDKITTNIAVLPKGDTLSPMVSVQQDSFESSSYTPGVNYLEVAFSPQDQINDDINAQMGYFNLGDYIGDPRHISQSGRSYPDLDTLRDTYFEKYISGYNLVDFVRLMKFFDNSLFKMIKDFTPARTSLTSGVVVKQHILERNRVKPPVVSHENLTYSGSIKAQSRNYNTGSGDTGQYEYISGSSLYQYKGGTGGSFEVFNGVTNTRDITQVYSESIDGPLGRRIVIISDQEEFYNGEFSGSSITAVTQSLSPDCIKYHDNPDIPLQYYPLFFSDSSNDFVYGTTTLERWSDRRNEPQRGYVWFFTTTDEITGEVTVKKIKLAALDKGGNDIRDSLIGTEFVQFAFPEGFKMYFSEGTVINDKSATLTIEQDRGDYLFASSSDGGSENWSLRVSGNESGSYFENGIQPGGFDPGSQNYFHGQTQLQIQPIRYYNGVKGDILGFFNTGSPDYKVTSPFNNVSTPEAFDWGSYIIPRTSNVPWVLSASIAYSASGGGAISAPIDTQGIYHTGSYFGADSLNKVYAYDSSNFNNTASIILSPFNNSNSNLDSTFFSNIVDNSMDGDQLNGNRISYKFSTDTTFGNNNSYEVAFNHADINQASQMFISLKDNEDGIWYTDKVQIFNQASSWKIYNPSDENNYISVRNAQTVTNTSTGNPFFANSGNFWMIKSFTPTMAELVGSAFSDLDAVKVIPNTIQDASGHAKIIQAGTASLDFDFFQYASNTFGASSLGSGTTRPGGPRPVPPMVRYASGPNGAYGYSTNLPLTPDIKSSTIGTPLFITADDLNSEFYIQIRNSDLFGYLQSKNRDGGQAVILKFSYMIRITDGYTQSEYAPGEEYGAPQDIGVALYVSKNGGSYNRITNTATTATGLGNNVQINNKQYNITSILEASGPNSNDTLRFKIGFKLRSTENFKYYINYWNTQLQYYSTNLDDVGSGNQGFQDQDSNPYSGAATHNNILLHNSSQGNFVNRQGLTVFIANMSLKATLREYLYITGSGHHPRQLITASNELVDQFFNQSAIFEFPDSPINNIYRTSSYNVERFSVTESIGSSVTFQYTDPHTENLITSTLTSASHGLFGIRQGGTQPTKISGTGNIVNNSMGVETLYPTINTTQSMYFIETRISSGSINGGTEQLLTIVSPALDEVYPKLIISNSIASEESGYKFTGSVQIFKGNKDNTTSYGTPIFSQEFIVPTSASARGEAYTPGLAPTFSDWSTNNIQLSGSFIKDFAYNDSFRIVVRADKNIGSFLDITEYTMSLFPSESKFGSITEDYSYYGQVVSSASYGNSAYGGEKTILTPNYGKYSKPLVTDTIVPSYYGAGVLPFALALDCQPLINNYNNQRKSSYLMDVDYSNISGSITPVNFLQIISGSATKATVPDSNYTQESWTSLRYDGTKAQSEYINRWTPMDFGTYGQLPVLELRNAYFGYFSSMTDSYPIINDTTRLNLAYLIDPAGNALPPSLQGVALDIIDKTFPQEGNSKLSVSLTAETQELEEINAEHVIKFVGKYPVPVMYSQNSSRGYASTIPLTGSGRISVYDNPGTGFSEFSFTTEGTASLTPGRNVKGVLNPSSNYILLHPEATNVQNAYNTSSADGKIDFADEAFPKSGELSQMQYISLTTSVPTTYISSGDYHKKGNFWKKSKSREYIEFTLKLGLKYTTGGTTKYIPFVAEDIRLRVWKGGVAYDAGSVTSKIAFESASPTTTTTSRGSAWRKSRTTSTYKASNGLKLDRENKLHAKINEKAVNDILSSKGLSGKGIEDGGSIEGLEWIITANSGENIYKNDSILEWEIDSSILPGNNGKNTILPGSFTGPKGATKISMIGSKSHLLANDNQAFAPYWVFGDDMRTGQVPTSDTTHNFIYMSSSLFNEGYGNSYSQAELPYTPGPYEGFPTGQEPDGVKIGVPASTLIIEEGDEIRFANNENYSYKVNTVSTPQSNIHPDGAGYIKLELDRPIPASINKDFFLVRRYIESAGSVFIDLPYPYTNKTVSVNKTSQGETGESTGKILMTPDALLGSVTTQPTNGNPISYTDFTLGVNSNSGTGTGAKVTMIITQTGGVGTSEVSYIKITNPGSGYKVNDVLSIDNIGGSTGRITLTALNIELKMDNPQQNESKPFSSAGILFPDYPILELETSASIIVNNLISKGVIQS